MITCLLLCASLSRAQELFTSDDERVFHAGLSLGINFCQVDGDGLVGYHKVGLAGGATIYTRLLPILHASLGIGYSQKGSVEPGRYRLNLNYVELPLLFHLFPKGKFHYSAGASYNRLISSKEEAEDAGIVVNEDMYSFHKADWNVMAGVSYHLSGQWFLSGQYQYTIQSMRDVADIPPGYGYANERNNVVSLRLLYIVPSGGAR
jgi:opacity protein-like surface antigen